MLADAAWNSMGNHTTPKPPTPSNNEQTGAGKQATKSTDQPPLYADQIPVCDAEQRLDTELSTGCEPQMIAAMVVLPPREIEDSEGHLKTLNACRMVDPQEV